jgi:hypothetical protein
MSAGAASAGLPGLKRYAGNEGEYAEIMRRHLTMLAGLLSKGNADAERELMAVTISWSGDPGPVPRTADSPGRCPPRPAGQRSRRHQCLLRRPGQASSPPDRTARYCSLAPRRWRRMPVRPCPQDEYPENRQGPLQALGAAPGPAAATPRHVISSVPGKIRTPAVRCWNRPL